MEWSPARQIAANYQSPGPTGIGFAQFASTGTVTPELWDNIRSCEAKAGELYAEGWKGDMAHLRLELAEEGIHEETLKDRAAKRALAAVKAYAEASTGRVAIGEPGPDSVFSETLQDLLTDLRWLCWDNGITFPDLDESAGDRWIEELDEEREAGRED